MYFIPSKHTPHVDDRRGRCGEHDGAEKAERVDRMVRPGSRQVMIDSREKDEDERHDDRGGERLESRKSCEEDTTDAALQRRGEVQLDELSESFDDSALRHRIQSWRRERGPVSVLSKVSKRWHACLKKHIDVLRAEIARLEAHRAFLVDTRDKVYNIRVSGFGEPRDPWDEDY